MRILVLNAGSSSVKFALFDASREERIAEGVAEEIGTGRSRIKLETPETKLGEERELPDHDAALDAVFRTLISEPSCEMDDLSEIAAVGHRVVHGGEKFVESSAIDEKVIAAIRDLCELAPLHNPHNLAGIEAAQRLLPHAANIAVFDTQFHATIPPVAYRYALPKEWYERYGVRRFGFHGTSHKYVTLRAAAILRRDITGLRLISCHLGNGASVAAVGGGKSVDTSMGFSPLPGLVMGTRPGDFDPTVIFHLESRAGLDLERIERALNRECGLAALSGAGSDMRTIELKVKEGDEEATLAHDIFCYRLRQYIGSYAAVLEGADAIIFTGGIGEHSSLVREKVCSKLKWLGLKLDREANGLDNGEERTITTSDSVVQALVIPTDEELMIALEVKRLRGEKTKRIEKI
ncbi:MAG: acetate kinase [Planctomycetota bacterium]|nr:MAG: acetate kinase [Planctomycetota bacterium]